MPKTIVVAAHGDDHPAREALGLALRLARPLDAQLLVATVVVPPLGAEAELGTGVLRTAAQRDLDRLAARLPDTVTCTTLVVEAGSVARGLSMVAEEQRPDLVVLGATHRFLLGRIMHGNHATDVLRDVACPVAVAPAGHFRSPRAVDDDVVVGVDGGPESRAALDAGADLAERLGIGLRIVHVIPAPSVIADLAVLARDRRSTVADATRREGEALVQEAAAAVAGRVPVSTAVVEGEPTSALAALGDDAGWVVVGSRAMGAARRAMSTSTSARLLAHPPACPLLVVPHATPSPPPERAAVAEEAR